MSMTIQSSVKDKILATSSETSKVENALAEMLLDLDQQMEKRADDGKANVVTDALSRKERVKPRRVRAMAMTIQYGVRGMILTTQSEAFKQENVPLVGSEMDEAHASSKEWNSGDDQLRLRWMIYLVVLADAAESVRDTIRFECCLASSSGWTNYHSSIWCAPFEALYGRKCRSPVLWAEVEESSLIGPELVQETTDKVVLIKEKLKVGKLAPRYVGPFDILERVSPIAYRLRLPEELSGERHHEDQIKAKRSGLKDRIRKMPLRLSLPEFDLSGLPTTMTFESSAKIWFIRSDVSLRISLSYSTLKCQNYLTTSGRLQDKFTKREAVKIGKSPTTPIRDMIILRLADIIKEWNSGDDQLRLRWMIYLVVLADAAESVRDTIKFKYYLASLSGMDKCKRMIQLGDNNESPVLWAEIGESSLIGPELVYETTDKIRVGDRVMPKVSPLEKVLSLWKKVLLDEIKVDKTLCFVKEPVEIMDHEVKSLKRSRVLLVKVH
ncbi:hypothetical protein Tco_0566467 [Tanacetum coccineum]